LANHDYSQVRILSEREYEADAQEAFAAVFRTDDPFDEPFQPWVRRRGLLYPIEMMLEKDQLHAVAKAVEPVGEAGFFLSVTERPTEAEQAGYPNDWHWWIPLREVGSYYSLRFPGVLQNAVYSQNGSWGILISNERHAVLGGNPHLVGALYAELPAGEATEVHQFVAD
jgi:hypothetical protein